MGKKWANEKAKEKKSDSKWKMKKKMKKTPGSHKKNMKKKKDEENKKKKKMKNENENEKWKMKNENEKNENEKWKIKNEKSKVNHREWKKNVWKKRANEKDEKKNESDWSEKPFSISFKSPMKVCRYGNTQKFLPFVISKGVEDDAADEESEILTGMGTNFSRKGCRITLSSAQCHTTWRK